MSNIYTALTQIGLAKIVNAITLGQALNITQVALGDAIITPAPNMTALGHEVWRGAVHSIMKDPENPTQIIVEAIVPQAAGGWTVREIGLYDNANDLIAIGTLAPVLKEPNLVALTVTVVFNIGADQTNGLQLLSPQGMATMEWASGQFIPRLLSSQIALHGDDYIPFVRQGQPMAVLWDVLRTLLGATDGSGTANGGHADTASLADRLNIKSWDLVANTSGAGAPATFISSGEAGIVGGATALSAPDAEGWQTLSGTDIANTFMWASTGPVAASGRQALRVKVPDNTVHTAMSPMLYLLIVDGAASAATIMAAAANPGQSPGVDMTAVQCFPQSQTFPATVAAQGVDFPLGATQPNQLTNAPPAPISFAEVALGESFRIGVDSTTGEVFIGRGDGTEQSLGQSPLLQGKTSLQFISVCVFYGRPSTGSTQIDASAPLGATQGYGGNGTLALPAGTLPGMLLQVAGAGTYRGMPLADKDIALTLANGDIENLGRPDLSNYVTQQQLATLTATVKPQSVPYDGYYSGSVTLLTNEGKLKRAFPGQGIELFDYGTHVEIRNSAPASPSALSYVAAAGQGWQLWSGVSNGTLLLRGLIAGSGMNISQEGDGDLKLSVQLPVIEDPAQLTGVYDQAPIIGTIGLAMSNTGAFRAYGTGYATFSIVSDAHEAQALGHVLPPGTRFELFADEAATFDVTTEQGVVLESSDDTFHLTKDEAGFVVKLAADHWFFGRYSGRCLARGRLFDSQDNWTFSELKVRDSGKIVYLHRSTGETQYIILPSSNGFPVGVRFPFLNTGTDPFDFGSSLGAVRGLGGNLLLTAGQCATVMREPVGDGWMLVHGTL